MAPALPAEKRSLDYVFGRPDWVVTLPPVLQEISGIAVVSPHEIACVQDEKGTIFFYHLGEHKISRQIRFGPPGDYEGLAAVGSDFFVLRSDGQLFVVSGSGEPPSVRTYSLGLPTLDNEGLCFDPARGRLLIAPKSRLGRERELRDLRPIFGFDLASRRLLPEPVVELSLRAVRDYAAGQGLLLPKRMPGKGSKPKLRFLPSDLGVHPVTGELVILSSVDQVIVSSDLAGRITGYALLEAELFPQPEGIAFFQDGDMLISNEGAGRQATLLRFSWKGKGPAMPASRLPADPP